MIPLYRLRMRMRKHYPGGMSKYLYARVSDDAHAYIVQVAAAEHVSMGEIVRRLVHGAQFSDWEARVEKMTLPEILTEMDQIARTLRDRDNNSEMISDNGGLSS
jgi:hypothetical protein